jgi:flagellar biosynthesis protein FlhG
MKSFSEQNHYEILEIPRSASPGEIERAFRMAQATYAEESLAGYSVFGEGEAAAIRERIETAYRVLTHPETRAAYDAMLGDAGPPPAGETVATPVEVIAAASEGVEPELRAQPAARPLEELEEEGGEFTGGRLRRTRIDRGIELDEIAGWTKINPTYLQFIEEDRYADLPAPVYVRGFVTAYAQCVGLDAKQVARSYMQSFEDGTRRGRRGRFLGGR